MSDLFKKIESSSNLDRSTIMNVAESVKNANFQDEKVVRNLIQQLSAMTGKSVNKKTETPQVEEEAYDIIDVEGYHHLKL